MNTRPAQAHTINSSQSALYLSRLAHPTPDLLTHDMSDSTKQERIEEFLRKSLLGEELVQTQFHLFSARSSPSRRVLKPRVLCANNVLLAKSSKYFLDRECWFYKMTIIAFIDTIQC